MVLVVVLFKVVLWLLLFNPCTARSNALSQSKSKPSSPPHIFHFIWWQGADDMAARAVSGVGAEHGAPNWRAQFVPRWIESWSTHHPTWQKKMWDGAAIIELAKELKYLDLIQSLPERIKKIDMARYLILLKHGGVVLDIDFECFKAIDSLIEGHSAILVEESADQSINCVSVLLSLVVYRNTSVVRILFFTRLTRHSCCCLP